MSSTPRTPHAPSCKGERGGSRSRIRVLRCQEFARSWFQWYRSTRRSRCRQESQRSEQRSERSERHRHTTTHLSPPASVSSAKVAWWTHLESRCKQESQRSEQRSERSERHRHTTTHLSPPASVSSAKVAWWTHLESSGIGPQGARDAGKNHNEASKEASGASDTGTRQHT